MSSIITHATYNDRRSSLFTENPVSAQFNCPEVTATRDPCVFIFSMKADGVPGRGVLTGSIQALLTEDAKEGRDRPLTMGTRIVYDKYTGRMIDDTYQEQCHEVEWGLCVSSAICAEPSLDLVVKRNTSLGLLIVTATFVEQVHLIVDARFSFANNSIRQAVEFAVGSEQKAVVAPSGKPEAAEDDPDTPDDDTFLQQCEDELAWLGQGEAKKRRLSSI